MTDQALPHNLDAEKAILGGILLNPALYPVAAETIGAEDFYRHAHQVIFRHVARLAEQGVAIDFVTLVDSLTRSKDLEAVDGPTYLSGLTDGQSRSVNVPHYARIVKEKAQLRALIAQANRVLVAAYDADEDAAAQIATAQQALTELAADRQTGGYVCLADIITTEVYPQLEAWAAGKGALTGIGSGLVKLDEMTGGFKPGQLVVIAGRPSMGKSALAGDLARAAAAAGKTVAMHSLEMSTLDLGLRIVSAESGLEMKRMERGYYLESDWGRLSAGMSQAGAMRLHIDPQAAVSVKQIRSRALRLKARHGLDLLLVDYLQLMQPAGKRENRNLDVTEMSAGLKGLAKELGIPVILLSQLNRDLERRTDKRPVLSDLRDSGAIEQDADVVIMVYREVVYVPTADPTAGELIVAKQRNGPTGMVPVTWDAAHTRFLDRATVAA